MVSRGPLAHVVLDGALAFDLQTFMASLMHFMEKQVTIGACVWRWCALHPYEILLGFIIKTSLKKTQNSVYVTFCVETKNTY